MNIRPSQTMTVAEQAAGWLIELEEDTDLKRLPQFAHWLKSSPQNVEEFLTAAAAWERFNHIDGNRQINVRQLVLEAANVVPLEQPPLNVRLSGTAKTRWMAAAALVLLSIAGILTYLMLPDRRIIETAAGEQRAFKLDDGSIVNLNTHSRLQLQYSQTSRELRLLEGEALFTVEKDPQRPFRVHSGGAVIQALGTQFNVYRRAGDIEVAVLEGSVKVQTNATPDATAGQATTNNSQQQLDAGWEARIANSGAITKRSPQNIADAVAWRERRLIFRDDPLKDIVTEFNRYNEQYPIELEENAGLELRLTGVFKADDPDALLLYLEANSDLSVDKRNDRAIIRRP